MSVLLQWMVVQNCSSVLIKRNKQTYSTKSSNLKAHTPSATRPTHHKTVDVKPTANGNIVVVVMKQRSGQQKPATSYMRADHHQQEQLGLGLPLSRKMEKGLVSQGVRVPSRVARKDAVKSHVGLLTYNIIR
uniref:Large ribosomal subunit protein eL28 n=1 Tax=Theropithecus gelada TaxID=9565 RepID=A0A8D2FNB8_THEGE